tara:strand:+ start:369 stop:572 length:204 start_codon:yes stop_codon:yes gene_type:complete
MEDILMERMAKIIRDLAGIVDEVKHATTKKPKRARTKTGRYRADDKLTKGFNEAWVGGKSPTDYKKS